MPGMQATIFSLIVKADKADEEKRLVGKRVVPSELPPKANTKM